MMTNKTIFNPFLWVVLSFIAFSCDNEGTEESTQSEIARRVTTEYVAGPSGIAIERDEFVYDGDKLSEIIWSMDNSGDGWKEISKMFYEYEGNRVNVYTQSQSEPLETPELAESLLFENGRLVERTDYVHTRYVYNGDRMQYIQIYESAGDAQWYKNYTIEYAGDKVVRISSEYDENYEYASGPAIEEFTYEGDKLVKMVKTLLYNDKWQNMIMVNYTYEGDKVSVIEEYGWNSMLDDWAISNTLTHKYDEYGDLVSFTEGIYTSTYEYESGKGNVTDVIKHSRELHKYPTPRRQKKSESKYKSLLPLINSQR
ncbi:hypothetical protein [Aureibacter tunicatorum]|uniref:YD repeat-containing protein n=1 Tax=Aureibacter tunicatorum TaxID=866807 RepID=A0AAE3XP95_9BACT|nr:hypothetical protein [Aureibacter tunicatorum]MDR6240097.1 hypothetical protein [Aureibacter tunicatorum]